MTPLAKIVDRDFDVVAMLDNALPHLSPDQVSRAVAAAGAKLKSGGILLASIRDYDSLLQERPAVQGPEFYGAKGARRIVHQVWDWKGAACTLHLYITTETERGWSSHHFTSRYRCLLRDELSRALADAGFGEVRWIMPDESGYFQPLVVARWKASPRAGASTRERQAGQVGRDSKAGALKKLPCM